VHETEGDGGSRGAQAASDQRARPGVDENSKELTPNHVDCDVNDYGTQRAFSLCAAVELAAEGEETSTAEKLLVRTLTPEDAHLASTANATAGRFRSCGALGPAA
jgi:hypothetical protein